MQAPGASDVWLEQAAQFGAAWATNADLLKAGRVLSSGNIQTVESAIASMQSAITALNDLLTAAKPPDEMALTTARDLMTRRINIQLSELNLLRGN